MANSPQKKRAKLVEEINQVENEDRISQIPISIIPCILSLLPLKDAVRTNVLSKMWNRLWLSSDVLDFDDAQVMSSNMIRYIYSRRCSSRYDAIMELSQKYVRWVNNIMASHENHDLDRFRIRFQLPLNGPFIVEIGGWIADALSRKVKNLELDFTEKPDQNMLFFPFYHFPQELHAITDVSCLRSLSLSGVYVDRNTIESILCNFHSLEHLKVCSLDSLPGFCLRGSSRNLTHLEITDCRSLRFITVMDKCLRKLTLERNPELVFVCAPDSINSSKLEALVLNAVYRPDEVVDGGLPNLSEVKELNMIVDPVGKETPRRLISILCSCAKLERFVLKFGSVHGRGKKRRTLRNKEYLTECPTLSLPCLKEVEVRGYYCDFFEDEILEFIFRLIVTAPLKRVVFNPSDVTHNLPTNRRDSVAFRVGRRAENRAILLKRLIPSSVEFISL